MTRPNSHPQPEPLRTVVLADADADMRALYRELLRDLPIVLLEASDGRDALVKCLVQPPALLITDARLPGVDGFALCELLRRDAATRAVPILVMTSDSHPVQLARFRQVGASVILSKPVAVEPFVSAVARLYDDPTGPPATSPTDAAAPLPEPGAAATPRAATRTFRRFDTTTPPAAPPALRCISCDTELDYHKSRIGGVTQRDAEQWDEFRCPRCLSAFEYRHRTRKIRLVR